MLRKLATDSQRYHEILDVNDWYQCRHKDINTDLKSRTSTLNTPKELQRPRK